MSRRNPQAHAGDLTFNGVGDYDFDRPAPQAQPKRLQRISRSGNHSNSNVAQQQQQQQYTRPASQNSHNSSSFSTQQRTNTLSRQYLHRDSRKQFPQLHQQQQQQQMAATQGRPSLPYEEPSSPSAQSDFGPMSHPPAQHLPGYPRAQSSSSGSRQGIYPSAAQHHNYAHMTGSAPVLPGPYPSAMVVGGGMPAHSRIVPSQALVNAVASTEIPRSQRERDFANALGRRRPTHGSVSSSGSSDQVLGNVASFGPEKPYNANAPMEQGLPYAAPAPGASVMSGGTQNRYRVPLPNHPLQQQQYQQQHQQQQQPYAHAPVDMRVGRSVSSASTQSNGYRGSYNPSPYATQRGAPQMAADAQTQQDNQLRKQASAMSMNNMISGMPVGSGRYGNNVSMPDRYHRAGSDASPVMRHNAHPGSRSAPDLHMDAMKGAINEVAHNLDRNPVPQIPSAYSQPQQTPMPRNSHPTQQLPPIPQHPSNLSIRTDVTHGGGGPQQQQPSQQQQQQQQPGQQPPLNQQMRYGNAATAPYPYISASASGPPAPLSAMPMDRSAPLAHGGGDTILDAVASSLAQANGRPPSAGTKASAKTPATADTSASMAIPPPIRSEPVPVNTGLVVLLENVKPVYPAMLSLVAKSFCEIISQVLQTRERNGLEHPQCFTGRDAVDAVYAIIKAADRNLAIVVGRALEQQQLFHDVDYEKRLRDDPNELYAFDDELMHALMRQSEEAASAVEGEEEEDDEADEESTLNQDSSRQSRTSLSAQVAAPGPVINGIFVMLTDCYSPTCSSSQPCYSVTCPRQRAQQDHLRKTAKSNVAGEMKQEKLWSMSVPKEIVKSVSRKELDRQERLYEVFYGEKDYVRDLCILRDLYMKPLHNGDIVREDRRKNFITKVFKNALAILAENMELHKALEKRQKEEFVCYQVGDVFLQFVQHLEAYLEYCANQPYSMHFLDAEKRNNKRLVEFLEKTDRRPECRKLGVQHFLTRPPTRLARYPLVLRAVLKYTPEGHPDRETIPYVIGRIESMLQRINLETGKAQNRLRLFRVDDKLECSVADRNNLRLTDEQRKLVRDSPLRKRGGSENSAIQVMLLDHMLLMCKVKTDSQTGDEKYTIYKHPIPLQLLTICNPDDPNSTRPRMAARRDSSSASNNIVSPSGTIGSGGGIVSTAAAGKGVSATSPNSTISAAGGRNAVASTSSSAAVAAPLRPTIIPIDHGDSQKEKYAFPLQFTHLGRNGFTVTLYANKLADRQQWYQCIEEQQLELMERHRKFELVPVSVQFPAAIRINTADVYDQGRGVVIGTDRGLYLGVAGRPRSFQQLNHLRHDRVYQIEIHEKLNVLAMIADKDRNLYVYPLDLLMSATTTSRSGVRAKPLHAHVSFFRFGKYQDMDILCSVRSTTLSNQTIIHVYKPVVNQQRNRALGRFLSLGGGGEGGGSAADSWRCIKECYIAAESTSLHFLRSRLCVGCSRGFEIVDLATMNTQSLLDPADSSLSFINKRENTHPIALFRVHDGEFLLCYDVFAFYVNRNGQRARFSWMIHWVGTPTSFKFEYPYVLAFDSQFIEVRHVETAAMVQVIITGNCTSLSPNKDHVNLCVTSPSATQPQEVMRIQHMLAKDPL